MKIEWWEDFLERVEKCGRADEAASQLHIRFMEMKKLFDARPDLLDETRAAQKRYYEQLADRVLYRMLQGNTFSQACSTCGVSMADGKKLLKISTALEAAHESQIAMRSESPGWIGADEEYTGPGAITVTWGVNYSGRIIAISFHKPGCLNTPKSTNSRYLVKSMSVTHERAMELLPEAEKLVGKKLRTGCTACRSLYDIYAPKGTPAVYFRVSYEENGVHYKKVNTREEAIEFAKEVGATSYLRVERVDMPKEDK